MISILDKDETYWQVSYNYKGKLRVTEPIMHYGDANDLFKYYCNQYGAEIGKDSPYSNIKLLVIRVLRKSE